MLTDAQRAQRADAASAPRRRRDALQAHALTDLGKRGTLPLGTRMVARGGTRQRTTHDAPMGVGYAFHDACGAYHYAFTWSHQRADSLRNAPKHAHAFPRWGTVPRVTKRNAPTLRVTPNGARAFVARYNAERTYGQA